MPQGEGLRRHEGLDLVRREECADVAQAHDLRRTRGHRLLVGIALVDIVLVDIALVGLALVGIVLACVGLVCMGLVGIALGCIELVGRALVGVELVLGIRVLGRLGTRVGVGHDDGDPCGVAGVAAEEERESPRVGGPGLAQPELGTVTVLDDGASLR